jgi:histone deacetylase 3
MTVSFHKYTGDFFPGTGKLDDNGAGPGKNFCINVPLLDGIDDDMYLTIFKTVIDDTVTVFRPSSIVLQCGADSLGCDRLGAFNLSIAAHGECVNFVRKYNVPLLVLGGGGYTIKNVSRCWTYETSVLIGAGIPDELPATVYDSFFADSQWKLHPPLTGKVDNQNSPVSLQRITITVRNKLRYLQGAPSVAMQEIPPDLQGLLPDENRTAEEKDEERGTGQAGEKRLGRSTARNEFYDSDKDNDQDSNASLTKGRAANSNKKTRGGRRARGRGRGRGATTTMASSADNPEILPPEGETEKETAEVAAAKRGRGRGRTRARGVRARSSVLEVEKETEGSTPPTEISASATPATMEVDVEP